MRLLEVSPFFFFFYYYYNNAVRIISDQQYRGNKPPGTGGLYAPKSSLGSSALGYGGQPEFDPSNKSLEGSGPRKFQQNRTQPQEMRAQGPAISSSPPSALQNPLYKTKLCERFEQEGACPYETRCTFAHGAAELRVRLHQAPESEHHNNRSTELFKTRLCARFMSQGHCDFEGKCIFAHGEAELRPLPASASQGNGHHSGQSTRPYDSRSSHGNGYGNGNGSSPSLPLPSSSSPLYQGSERRIRSEDSLTAFRSSSPRVNTPPQARELYFFFSFLFFFFFFFFFPFSEV